MVRLRVPLGDDEPELVWCFSSRGPFARPLRIASNCELEVWLDHGAGLAFAGDGGHRCSHGEALADAWPEVVGAREVLIKARAIDPARTECLHRDVFADAFVDVDVDAAPSPGGAAWSIARDPSLSFRARCSAQLPRQCVVTSSPARLQAAIGEESAASSAMASSVAASSVVAASSAASSAASWHVMPSPLRRARFVAVEPRLVSRRAPSGVPRVVPGAMPTEMATVVANEARAGVVAKAWRPDEAEDVGAFARENAAGVVVDTWDLGAIALHRFEVDAKGSAVALVVSEVERFEDVWASRSRRKVSLAAAVAAGVTKAAPFGVLGGRYVHVLYAQGEEPLVKAWRREYPLVWKDVEVEPGCGEIVAACRANLVACVDGGVVDTCWRERAQWTGDMRMSAIALRALCENPEVAALAIRQIGASYEEERAMVRAVAPAHHHTFDLCIPGFHLAFCHAVLDDGGRDDRSIDRWRALHVRDGLVQGVRGWAFTDWDPLDARVEGVGVDDAAPHAVVNAWWVELCARLGVPSGVDGIEAAFRRDRGYGLLAHDGKSSIHASAAFAAAGVGDVAHALAHLDAVRADIPARVTPYFAYFVARAFERRSRADAIAFIRDYYGPIAKRYGTIYERTNADYSMAHGWSVGVAAMCLR